MKIMSSFAVAAGIAATLAVFFIVNKGNQNSGDSGPITVSVKGYKPLPNDLYGFNIQFSRVTDPWAHPEFIRSVEDIHPSTIRYPGGTVSSFWDVEHDKLFPNKPDDDNGWVDYDKFPNSFITKMVDKNFAKVNSLEDLSTIVKKSNIIPVFCLNMCTPGQDYYEAKWKTMANIDPASSDATNAWWKMMEDRLNRNIDMLKRAQSLGIPIEYIELGNEYYASNIYFTQAFPDGVAYAKAANYFATKIKEQFPNAKFAAVGTKDARINRKSSRSLSWNRQLVSALDKTLIHAITIHAYEATDKTGYSSDRDLDDGINHWRSNINNAFQTTNVTSEVMNKGFDIWYTEFEAKYSMDFNDIRNPGDQNLIWANSLISAYVALYLQFQPNTSKIMYHKFDDLVNPDGGYKAKGAALIPIFKAAYGMPEASELTFTDPSNHQLKDMIGSAYKKDNTIKCVIINLSTNPETVDLKGLFTDSFKIKSYSDSNLMNDKSVTIEDKNATSTSAILPPYSVSIIEK